MIKDLKLLLKSFKINFHNLDLYLTAFTHSSYNSDAKTKHHDYERLEFLGDSVLGCVVSELAFKAHPEMAQGTLTKLKSSLVSTKALADFAREYKFQDYIRVGNSFSNDISKADSLLEDVFEAFIGALFLDQGFHIARQILISTLYSDIQRFTIESSKDYKSRLQEEMQAEHRESVVYKLDKEIGPSHNKMFFVSVYFDGIAIGKGQGNSKKEAEQMAAKDALSKKA